MSGTVKINEKSANEAIQECEKIVIKDLRKKHREQKLAYREHQRIFFFQKARFLENTSTTDIFSNDIVVLAKSLKNKSQVSCELLNAVMNALLNNKENVPLFLKVDGALQSLLRLLSGQNEKYQLIAAQCLCNLALGNEKEKLQVLKAAESYLMVHLTGRNQYVKEVCTVTLGNLCRQGVQSIELLMKQGFLGNILNLLGDADPSVEAAAVYALTQFIYYGFDELSLEDMMNCLLAVIPIFRKRSFLAAFLMSLFSCVQGTHSRLISEGIHFEALNHLVIFLEEKERESLYFLRMLCNLTVEEAVLRDLIESQEITIRKCFTYLLQSDHEHLQKECFNWLANIINNPTPASKSLALEILKENHQFIKLCKGKYAKYEHLCSPEEETFS